MTLNNLTVLHINKFHHIFGGAEVIYFRTADILEKHSHKSIFFAVRHPYNLPCETDGYFVPHINLDMERSGINYLMAIWDVLYSFKARRFLSKLLDRYPVDIAHIHNIHRQMSPSILHELKKRKIPIVMTLHEYKMICPSFLMFANGKPCEACNKGRYFNAIKLRCINGSFFRSALASIEMYLHHKVLDIYKNVDIFIAPSMFLKKKHEEMGFKKKIVHLPYPIDFKEFEKINSDIVTGDNGNMATFVYFGRLAPNKGLFTLIEAVKIISHDEQEKSRIELKIIGEGPISKELQEKVSQEGINGIRFLGFLKGERLFRELKDVLAVILPSEWYENYPVSVMEAFALGKPVIGARIGGIPELVKDGERGLTFESGNSVDLSKKIKYLINNPGKASEMGREARLFIEKELDSQKHYPKLMEIYKEAISQKN